MRILPPTGFRLTPDSREHFHDPLTDKQGMPLTVEVHEDALYLHPLREGEAPVRIDDIVHDGRPVYFGTPENAKPICIYAFLTIGGTYARSYGVADTVTGSRNTACPACQGKGIVNTWASSPQMEEIQALARYGLNHTGCYRCGETRMTAFPWRVIGTEESTGIKWLDYAGESEKEVVDIVSRFRHPPPGIAYHVEPA